MVLFASTIRVYCTFTYIFPLYIVPFNILQPENSHPPVQRIPMYSNVSFMQMTLLSRGSLAPGEREGLRDQGDEVRDKNISP